MNLHSACKCQWPTWPDEAERPPWPPTFCCAPVTELGRPYCEQHMRLAYLPPGQVQAPDPRSLSRPFSRLLAA